MENNQFRKATYDPPKKSLGYLDYDTLYPYIDYNNGIFTKVLAAFHRAVAPINPFAIQQVATEDRYGLAPRRGNLFHTPDPYPTYKYTNSLFATHYDPLKTPMRPQSLFHQNRFITPSYHKLKEVDYQIPRGCQRSFDGYKKCEMINGKDRCKQQMIDTIQVCPNWALDIFRNRKRKMLQISLIGNKIYRDVMIVADYNKGRSPKDISNKTFIHGTRKFLRPDSLWADDRYVDINQKQINEAKSRVAQRERGKGEYILKPQRQYDWQHQIDFEAEKPLYP